MSWLPFARMRPDWKNRQRAEFIEGRGRGPLLQRHPHIAARLSAQISFDDLLAGCSDEGSMI